MTSSSSQSPPPKYDVFLSFRGEDTRNNFISHLYAELQREKFIDYKLGRGDEISPELYKAIDESMIYVVVLSENYASSTCCLDELTHIIQCKKKYSGRHVIPVFYNVDPSDVRHQRQNYAVAFVKHQHRFKDDQVNVWKKALTQVAGLSGWDSQVTSGGPDPCLVWDVGLKPIGSWQKGRLLGSGSFASVYEVITEDGLFFAAKEVSLLDEGSRGRQSVVQLENEIALLSQFEHENIVRYIGTEKGMQMRKPKQQSESNLYIFLELVSKGSLLSLYRRCELKDSQVSAYTRQILHGLKYLHDRNIVHRDIKCANILVDANGSVKVADFGLAKVVRLNDVKSCQGTAFWMAPEVVNGQVKGYGLPADIWSLGCTVLEMLTGKIPYSPMEWMAAIYKIGKGELPPVPDSLSSDARDFILRCLAVNPDDRPTAAQLLDHKFVWRNMETDRENRLFLLISSGILNLQITPMQTTDQIWE